MRDIKPMPASVLGSSPKPMARELFKFLLSQKQMLLVRDDLLRLLREQYEEIYVDVGAGSRSQTVTQRARSFKKNIQKSMDFIWSVGDYGGDENIDRILCIALDPYWSAWWSSFTMRTSKDAALYGRLTGLVLSWQQSAWIAAQVAVLCAGRAGPLERSVLIEAAETAERACISPTRTNLETTENRRRDYVVMRRALPVPNSREGQMLDVAAMACMAASRTLPEDSAWTSLIDNDLRARTRAAAATSFGLQGAAMAISALDDEVNPYTASYSNEANTELTRLIRGLITPSLITRPSGAISSRGTSGGQALLSLAVGAAAGAAVVHFAKR